MSGPGCERGKTKGFVGFGVSYSMKQKSKRLFFFSVFKRQEIFSDE